MITVQNIIHFWFEEAQPSQWFKKDEAFDQIIHDRFYQTWQKASRGELASWRQTSLGRLAEIIVLDQFSRNLMRGKAESFAQDKMALVLAQELLKQEDFESALTVDQKTFAYMPFMHSESIVIQSESVALFEELGQQSNLDYAIRHRDIIERFNRFPHRNDVLGRTSTQEEIDFLKEPGSSF